jgi:hypothetical protein
MAPINEVVNKVIEQYVYRKMEELPASNAWLRWFWFGIGAD